MNQENKSFILLHPERLPAMQDHPAIVDNIELYENVKIGVSGHARTTHFSLDNKQTGCYGVCTHSQVNRPDGSLFHRRGYLFIHGDSCACLVPGQPTHFSDKAPEYLEVHAAELVAAGKICEKGSGVLVMQLFLGHLVSEELRIQERVALDAHVREQTAEGEKNEKTTSVGGDAQMGKEKEGDTAGHHDAEEKCTTWLRLL